jgi:hypothetical protein
MGSGVQLYHGGDRDRDRLARQLREARIKRFTERQRCRGEWINLADIAEWCSREDGSIEPNEGKRATAFDTLRRDLLAGEFEANGRSRVLFLHPAVAKARMTRTWLKDAAKYDYDRNNGRSYLAHCWIPRDLAKRWFESLRLPLPPWFTPPVPRSVPVASATTPRPVSPTAAVKRAKDSSREVGSQAGATASQADPRRPLTKRVADQLTTKYIAEEQASKRHPTISGLEAAARKAGYRGGREYLRAAYRRRLPAQSGRPPKPPS